MSSLMELASNKLTITDSLHTVIAIIGYGVFDIVISSDDGLGYRPIRRTTSVPVISGNM